VWEASGLDALKALLRARFFAVAGLLKGGTALRKVLDPCNQAIGKLRNLLDRRDKDLRLGQRSEEILARLVGKMSELDGPLELRAEVRSAVRADRERAEETQRALDALKHDAESHFNFLDEDMGCLQVLERLRDELTEEEISELHRLFGAAGPEVRARLGLGADVTLDSSVIDRAWSRRDHWAVRCIGILNALFC